MYILFYWISLSSSIKKIFSHSLSLSLSFSLSLSPASLLSSSFLLIFFFSPSSTLCFTDLFWIFIIADLHYHRPRCRPMPPTHLAQSSLTAHPTSTCLVLHLTADPSSIADLSFIVDPSSIDTTFIELKSAMDFVAMVGFRGLFWVSWKEGILVWICVWFQNGFEFVIWFWVCGLGIGGFGNGCGRWWLVAVGWVGFCSGFQFVSQWVLVDFSVFCSGFWWVVEWVGLLMVVVAWELCWWWWFVW